MSTPSHLPKEMVNNTTETHDELIHINNKATAEDVALAAKNDTQENEKSTSTIEINDNQINLNTHCDSWFWLKHFAWYHLWYKLWNN